MNYAFCPTWELIFTISCWNPLGRTNIVFIWQAAKPFICIVAHKEEVRGLLLGQARLQMVSCLSAVTSGDGGWAPVTGAQHQPPGKSSAAHTWEIPTVGSLRDDSNYSLTGRDKAELLYQRCRAETCVSASRAAAPWFPAIRLRSLRLSICPVTLRSFPSSATFPSWLLWKYCLFFFFNKSLEKLL